MNFDLFKISIFPASKSFQLKASTFKTSKTSIQWFKILSMIHCPFLVVRISLNYIGNLQWWSKFCLFALIFIEVMSRMRSNNTNHSSSKSLLNLSFFFVHWKCLSGLTYVQSWLIIVIWYRLSMFAEVRVEMKMKKRKVWIGKKSFLSHFVEMSMCLSFSVACNTCTKTLSFDVTIWGKDNDDDKLFFGVLSSSNSLSNLKESLLRRKSAIFQYFCGKLSIFIRIFASIFH